MDANFPWILVWWMGFSVVKRQVVSPTEKQLGALGNPAQHDRCNDNVCTGCLDWLVVVSPRCVTKRFGCVCEVWISVPECGECVVALLPLSLFPLPLHELVRGPGKGRTLLDILPASAFKADLFFWETELLNVLDADLSFAPFSRCSPHLALGRVVSAGSVSAALSVLSHAHLFPLKTQSGSFQCWQNVSKFISFRGANTPNTRARKVVAEGHLRCDVPKSSSFKKPSF